MPFMSNRTFFIKFVSSIAIVVLILFLGLLSIINLEINRSLEITLLIVFAVIIILLYSQKNESFEDTFNNIIDKGERAISDKNWGIALLLFHDALKLAEEKSLQEWIKWLNFQISEIHENVENEKVEKETFSDENTIKFNELIEKGETANEGKNWKLACLSFRDALKMLLPLKAVFNIPRI